MYFPTFISRGCKTVISIDRVKSANFRFLTDRSCDGDDLSAFALDHHAIYIIPPCRNREQSRNNDFYPNRKRHLFECFFNKVKHDRRLFSRFDKVASRYLGFSLFFTSPFSCIDLSSEPSDFFLVGHRYKLPELRRQL